MPPCYFKVLIYATTYPLSRPEILDNWPSIDTSLTDTILAAAPTNCVVWIHASLIDAIVYFPHTFDCVNQTYGNHLSGREQLFHVDHILIVVESGDEHTLNFERIEPSGDDSYHIFGYPRPNLMVSYTSYTERCFESISQITRLADSMLTKMGAVNSQVTKKCIHKILNDEHQGNLQWSHHSSYQVKTKITTDNMTPSAAKVKAAKWTITAHNVEGLQSLGLRAIIGPIGYGIKKKHPNPSAIDTVDGSNRLTVQEQDLIRVVDLNDDNILYCDCPSDDERINVGQFPLRQPNNFIRLS
jgi:hypothetical protein